MGALLRAVTSIAVGTLVVGLTAGCGSEDRDGASVASESATPSASAEASESTEPSPSAEEPSPPPASWPACSEVWVAGADLPSPYDGCAEGDIAVPADAQRCSMGAVLVTYDGRFWGVPGHVVSKADGPLNRDPDYRQARGACTA